MKLYDISHSRIKQLEVAGLIPYRLDKKCIFYSIKNFEDTIKNISEKGGINEFQI